MTAASRPPSLTRRQAVVLLVAAPATLAAAPAREPDLEALRAAAIFAMSFG